MDENAWSCPSISVMKDIYESSDHLFFIPDVRKTKGDSGDDIRCKLLTEGELEMMCRDQNDQGGKVVEVENCNKEDVDEEN